MIIESLLTILAGLLGVAVVLRLFFYPKDFYNIPAAKNSSAIFGVASDLSNPQIHQTLRNWCEQLGGLFRIRIAHEYMVVLTDPALVNHLLSIKGLPKSDAYAAVVPIGSPENIPSFFSTKDYYEWRNVRKGCAPAFSTENIRKTFPVVLLAVDDMIAHLSKRIESGDSKIVIDELAERITLDVIGLAGFDYDFRARFGGHCELFDFFPPVLLEFSLMVANPFRLPFYNMLPWLPSAKRYFRNCSRVHEIGMRLVQKIREVDLEKERAAKNSTLKTCLASLKDENTGKLFTDAQLLPNVIVFLTAGFDTTSHTVAWALYDLARHQDVQESLYDSLVQAGLAGSNEKHLDFSDMSNLEYLNIVLKESMRLHAVAATGTGRKMTEDVILGGHLIPKGMNVWIPFGPLMTSSRNFTRPQEFWPKRWQHEITADPGVAEATPSGYSLAGAGKSFAPFSIGERNCIGQNLAMMEARAVLVALVRRFKFQVASEMGDEDNVRAQEVMRLTLQTRNGIKLNIEKR